MNRTRITITSRRGWARHLATPLLVLWLLTWTGPPASAHFLNGQNYRVRKVVFP